MKEQEFWAKSDATGAIDEVGMPPTSLSLTVPKEVTSLVGDVGRFQLAANECVIDSEVSFQVADEIQNTLKVEAKKINDLRLDFTRPIDAIKDKWVKFFRPSVEARLAAVATYQSKMGQFRRLEREKAEKAQREAERLLAERRAQQEAEARRLEEKAGKLKTEKAREKALADAENIRTVAALTPTSVALSASAPQTVASNVAELWYATIESVPEFLAWIIEHREWVSVLQFKDAEMNRLAKQCQNVVKVPGVKFEKKDSFRSKSR